jgi:hypothetical protein
LRTAVTSLTFAAGGALTIIGDYAFQDCFSLGGALELPASLETIGRNAFYNTAVTSVSFAAAGALTTIGADAFKQCSSLGGAPWSSRPRWRPSTGTRLKAPPWSPWCAPYSHGGASLTFAGGDTFGPA